MIERDQHIIDLARSAALTLWLSPEEDTREYLAIEKFAQLIAEAEREACVKLCEKVMAQIVMASDEYLEGREMGAVVCANYIKARKRV